MQYSVIKIGTLLLLPQLVPVVQQKVSAQTEKTNFVIIYCDDMGYGDISCFGSPTIKTPHLDQMASEGQKWSSFYVSASVSSPSRAGLLTGRLGVRTGMYGNKKRVLFPTSPKGLPASEYTIAELLKAQGYTTACIGKWHIGDKKETMPLANGFDYFFGSPYSNDMSKTEQAKLGNKNYPYRYPLYQQDKVIEYDPDQTQLTKRLTQQAVSFIKKEKKHPFFLYLAHPMPHFPVYASEKFQGKSARGPYGDAVEEVDWSVGQVLSTLKQQGLDKNTLVVFTSDNGPWLAYKFRGGSAGPLKDGKASMFEGGFRVPCIMWGGMVKPGHITDMGSTLDLLPTFCELSGATLPKDRVYDGVSLTSTLKEVAPSPRHEFYYYRGNDLYAIRKGKYKIHFSYKPAYGPQPKKVYKTPHLFDIEQDPGEHYNIAAQHPELVKELTAYAKAYKAKMPKVESLFDAK